MRARKEHLDGLAVGLLLACCAFWGFQQILVKAIVGDREAGIALFEETVERTRSLGYEAETLAIGALGRRRAIRGEGGEAKELLAESLRRTLKLRAWLGTALYLDLLGDLAAAEGEDRLRAGARVGARGDA